MNDAERLAAIRALCDERRTHARGEGYDLAPDAFSERVRAVLDAPSSPTPATPDRDALVDVLQDCFPWAHPQGRVVHDAADRILALVGSGVRLTPDEWALIIDCLRDIPDMDERMAQYRPSRQREIDERRALAERLEREARP